MWLRQVLAGEYSDLTADYDPPRNITQVKINDYNPVILLAWKGNMDIHFIGEHSTTLNRYVTKYLSKSEKSFVFGIMNDVLMLCT